MSSLRQARFAGLFGQLVQGRRVGIGQDSVRGGPSLAEQSGAHVLLRVHRVHCRASAKRIDVRHDQPVAIAALGEHFALRRNHHASRAPERHDQINEVLRCPRAERCPADVAWTERRPA